MLSSRLLADFSETHLQAAERALNDGLPEITISRINNTDLNSFDDPNRASLILAEAYLDVGDANEAIKQLKKTPKHSEKKAHLLAKAYYSLGNWRKGLDQLKAISNPATDILKARFLIELNRSSEAITVLEKYLANVDLTFHAEAKLLLAQLYLQDGRAVAAESLLEDVTEFPTLLQASAQLLKAQTMLEKSQAEEALSLVEKIQQRGNLSGTEKNIANLLYAKCLIAQNLSTKAHKHLYETFPKLKKHSLLSKGLQLLRIIKKGSVSHKDLITEARTVIAEDRNQANAVYTPYLKLFLAELLLETANIDQLQEANELISGILKKSNHPLQSESYRILGTIQMKQGKPTLAKDSFLSAKKNDSNAFQAAYASWMSGDWFQAKNLFEQVAQSSNKEFAQAAKSNLATLIAADGEQDPENNANKDKTIQQSLLLEKAFKAVRENNDDAPSLLYAFLEKAPDHPRADEARLALAQVLIEQSPQNAETLLTLLNKISPESKVDNYRLINLKIKGYESLNQWENLIQVAKDFLKEDSISPKALLIRLKLAEAFFENGDYNKARLNFAEIVKETSKDQKNASIHEIALFYEAVSALRVATPASKEDAVKIFKKVIAINGDLSNPASKNIAEISLDLGNFEQAIKSAQMILEKNFPGSNEWMEGIVLSSHIKVSENKLSESLSFLNQGLQHAENKIFWKQQLLYLKALSHEKNRDSKKALTAYLLAIDSAPTNQKEQQSWYWFEQAGFRAIELLEQQKRWTAAVAAAQRIAAAKGPRAQEAIEYAKKTTLKHMLWDGELTPEKQ